MTPRIVWDRVVSTMPLIAILRGLTPAEAVAIGDRLEGAGLLCLEIPLNSPDPLTSIRLLRDRLDGRVLIGAGTVVSAAEVAQVQRAGGEFIVSPNTNPAVIRATKDSGLVSLPGFCTPSEAFAALEAGADALKLFPAELTPPPVLRALKSVLPKSVPILPVGGIGRDNMADYIKAGAAGFGIGSALYRPGLEPARVGENAREFVAAWQNHAGEWTG